jgi:hypothetical protein
MPSILCTSTPTISVGTSIYTSDTLTTLVPTGYYSTGGNSYYVLNGVVQSIGACSSVYTFTAINLDSPSLFSSISPSSWFNVTLGSFPLSTGQECRGYVVAAYSGNLVVNTGSSTFSAELIGATAGDGLATQTGSGEFTFYSVNILTTDAIEIRISVT